MAEETNAKERAEGLGEAPAAFLLGTPVEAAPVGLVVSDASGRVLFANAAARALGAEVAEPLERLVGRGERERFARLLAGARASERLRLGPPGRRRRAYAATAWRLPDGGRLWLIEPAPAGPAPDEAAARLAHELQAPIAVLRMAAEAALLLLDEGERDPAFLRRQFALIEEQGRRALDILAHMRGFARLGPGEPLDVRDCIAHALEARAEALAEAGIAVATELPAGPVMVRAHALPLEQALINLIDNARDAIRAHRASGGRIAIALTEGRGKVRISVADNGGGIAPEARRRLFEPFFTTKPAERASGLGLAIARDIARAFGGSLSARNQGEGAVFTLTLPALAPTPRRRGRARRPR